MDADALIIGAGLSGLVAACELIDAGKSVLIIDQEPAQNLGGQAFWSLGGMFLIDTPEQRRMGIRDSFELARQDWIGTAGFDRNEDGWPRQWADAYLAFAAGEKRSWLKERGFRFFPVVGWAERGGRERRKLRQFGAPVPHHMGHRSGRDRSVRGARSGGRPVW